MTIEALIDTKTGDVLGVKLPGSQWGRREINRVVKLDDEALEMQLLSLESAKNPSPTIAHPYAVFERPRPQQLVRSRVKVKVDDAKGMSAPAESAGPWSAEAAAVAQIAAVVERPLPQASDSDVLQNASSIVAAAEKDKNVVKQADLDNGSVVVVTPEVV